MGKIKDRLIYELTREPKEEKLTLQAFAGRMLAGFLVIMLLLSFLSRAADAVTIAKVTVGAVQSGDLTFRIEGTGSLEENAQKYVNIYSGVRVEQIFVREGQSIKEGDPLLQYDINDLKDILDGFEQELQTARLSYERDQLSYQAADADTAEAAARLNLERAKLDYEIAKKELNSATDRIKKDKKGTYEACISQYQKANEAYQNQVKQREDAVNEADEAVEEAQNSLNELYQDKKDAEASIEAYRKVVEAEPLSSASEQPVSQTTQSQAGSISINEFYQTVNNIDYEFYSMVSNIDTLAVIPDTAGDTGTKNQEIDVSNPVLSAISGIYKQYYGADEYGMHLKKVENARKQLERAKEDFTIALAAAAENGQMPSITQKSSLIRAYQDAYEALEELTENDTRLADAITDYGKAVSEKDSLAISESYNNLLSILYSEDDNRKQLMKAAEKAVAKAEQTLEDTKEEWDNTLQTFEEDVDEAQKQLSEALNTYNQISDNSYDYSAEVNAEEKQLTLSKRAVEDAETNLKAAQKNDIKSLEAVETAKQVNDLNLEIGRLDIEKKEKQVDSIQELIQKDGKVAAPMSGTLSTLELKVGCRTSGTELVCIAVEDFGFRLLVTDKEAGHLTIGDKVSFKTGRSDEISADIENISSANSEGMVEITGIMPEGNYSRGSKLPFYIVKTSDRYSNIIPIQALRKDPSGADYVLITDERDSILGSEITAVRQDVTLIDTDYTKAAIENGPEGDADIIVGSNKNIEEGDRVRVAEEDE